MGSVSSVSGAGPSLRHGAMAQAHEGRPRTVAPLTFQELLGAHPDLEAIAEAFGKGQGRLPEALPDGVPPVAGLPVRYWYDCLRCPPTN